MKVFFGMLVLASLMFCLDAERKQNVPKEKGSAKRNITIAYLLDGNGFKNGEAEQTSEVGKWLALVQEEAQKKLKEVFNVEINFVITEINITDSHLKEKIKYWSSGGFIHAVTFLKHMKRYHQARENPDIICVITKSAMYHENDFGFLAFFKHKTLCKSMVPMLLTYDQEKANDAGERLSKLVEKSTTSKKGHWKQYFRNCNKPKTVKSTESRQSIQY
uniref:Putative ixodes 26 kDa salivary protein n=1 Tax=Ixodes ricinus TaxID=34613 RepID=A0A0K8RG71_IXORI